MDGGDSPRHDFASEEHCRAAWVRHYDRMMRRYAKGGRRPQAWWRFEGPQRGLYRYPGYEHERSALYEFSDVLGAQERAELEAYWRREFERSWRPNFSFYAGGKIYSGDDARWQHWLAVDLPPPLLDKFMAERERRGQVNWRAAAGRKR